MTGLLQFVEELVHHLVGDLTNLAQALWQCLLVLNAQPHAFELLCCPSLDILQDELLCRSLLNNLICLLGLADKVCCAALGHDDAKAMMGKKMLARLGTKMLASYSAANSFNQREGSGGSLARMFAYTETLTGLVGNTNRNAVAPFAEVIIMVSQMYTKLSKSNSASPRSTKGCDMFCANIVTRVPRQDVHPRPC